MDEQATQKKKILVYEDDEAFRSSYVSALETHGFEVVAAGSPSELSIEEIKKLNPQLISTDMMMPGKTGVDFIAELRKDDFFKDTPVIFVSSVSDASRKADADALGAKAYFVKFQTPISNIASHIENLLQ